MRVTPRRTRTRRGVTIDASRENERASVRRVRRVRRARRARRSRSSRHGPVRGSRAHTQSRAIGDDDEATFPRERPRYTTKKTHTGKKVLRFESTLARIFAVRLRACRDADCARDSSTARSYHSSHRRGESPRGFEGIRPKIWRLYGLGVDLTVMLRGHNSRHGVAPLHLI